jgi:amidase
MAFREYANYDGIGLADLVRKKQVSAAELLDEAIARTAQVDPEINAVVVKHYDYARRQIDQGLPDGPFTGVPFLLKDLDLLATTRTTFGASLFKENVADHTGTLAQRFLDSGVTIFGKSSSPEFGLLPTTESRLFGPTRNPWNLAHSSGGSSGGAAAAVAARILPLAHASDGGGSIRIPASASGVFGMKPSRARNPLGPDRGEGWGGFACGHVVSISVRDSAVMLDAIHGPEASSPYVAPPPERPFSQEVGRDPGRLRIAFTDKSPYGDAIDPEIAAAVRDVAALLAGLGHHVEERAPVLATDPAAVISTIVAANTALTVRLVEQRLGREMTDSDFEVLTLASAPQCAKGKCDRLCGRATRRLLDFAGPRRLLRDLRRVPVSDALLATPAHRRDQLDVGRSVPHRADPAALHARNLHVQHVRPARDVGAAGLECGRIAARHDVRVALRRRGDVVPAGRPARTGATLAA